MALTRTEFRVIPKDVREWGRFFAQVEIEAGSTEIVDDAVTTDKIADSNVTLAKIANITADRVIGRLSSAGAPQELTAAQLATFIQDALEALNLGFTGNIGFHGEAASAQQADPGAPTIVAVSGTGDDVDVNANFSALEDAINGIRAALNTKGITG